MTPEDRIAELEDALREKERRIQELKTDIDKAHDLVQRQDEYVRDCNDLIDSWKEAFEMELGADGLWGWKESFATGKQWHDKYVDLVRLWNRNVVEFNAVVRRRNVGRPLAASDAQRQTVVRLRNAGKSLRAIADETNLGLSTVRTIVDQGDRRDRTTRKHLERIRRDMNEERTWQSRQRTRDSLPRRINGLEQQGAELHKEAKGLN